MSKRNNTASRSFIMPAIFRVSPSQGKFIIRPRTHHSLTNPERSGEYWSIIFTWWSSVSSRSVRVSEMSPFSWVPSQLRAGPWRIWFWYPWSLLVRISATTQLFAQSISDLINRQDKQLCAGQPALSFLFTQHSRAQQSSINPVTSNGITGPGWSLY